MAGGRPSKLTPELVEKAAQLAADGLPLAMIAEACDVNHSTCSRWMREAEEDGDELKTRFRQVIQKAERNWARSLVGSLKRSADDGNTIAATWILTHHPALRDHFSDAAATRREVQRTMGEVVNAIEATPGLSVEQREAVLLSLAARGLGGTAAQ